MKIFYSRTDNDGKTIIEDFRRSDGVWGWITGDVTLEKCVSVADDMGYPDSKKMGEKIFYDIAERTMEKLKCKRCGWEWTPRTEKPRQCPGCKSMKWDEDREGEKK